MQVNRIQSQLNNPLGNPSEVAYPLGENISAPPPFNLGSLPLPPPPRLSSTVSQGPFQSAVPPSVQQQAATQTQMGSPQVNTSSSAQPILGLAVSQRSITVPVDSPNRPGLSSSDANDRIQNWLEDVFVNPNNQDPTRGRDGRNTTVVIDPHPFGPTLQEVSQNATVSTMVEQRGGSIRRTSAPTRPSPSSPNTLARLTDTKMPPRQPPSSSFKHQEGSNFQENASTEPQTPRKVNRTIFSSVKEAEAYSDIHGGGSKIVQTPRGDISVFTTKRGPSQPISKVFDGEESNGVVMGSMATEGLVMGNLDSSRGGIGSTSGVLNQVDNTRAMTDTYWGIRPTAPPVRHPAGPSSPTPRSIPARSPSPIPRRGSTSSIPPTSYNSSSRGLQESSPTRPLLTSPQIPIQPTLSPTPFPMPSLDIDNSPPTIQQVSTVGNVSNFTDQATTDIATETVGPSHTTSQTYVTYFADELPPYIPPTDSLPDLVPNSPFPQNFNTHHPQHRPTVDRIILVPLPTPAQTYLLFETDGHAPSSTPSTELPPLATVPIRQPTAAPMIYAVSSSADGMRGVVLMPGGLARELTSAPIVHAGASSVPPAARVPWAPAIRTVSGGPPNSSTVASRESIALVVGGGVREGGSEQTIGAVEQSEESTQGQARAEEATLWEVFERREWLPDGDGGETDEAEEVEDSEGEGEGEESGSGNRDGSWMAMGIGLLR